MAKPIQSTTVDDSNADKRGPKDLLGDKSPPDPRTGLNPQETMQEIEDAARAEKRPLTPARGVDGAFNHAKISGADKCGAKYGRCFGEVVNGVCKACGADYRRTTPAGGTNDPALAQVQVRPL